MVAIALYMIFHAKVRRKFNKMQMIFRTLSGSSGQIHVTPFGGNRMYCALLE